LVGFNCIIEVENLMLGKVKARNEKKKTFHDEIVEREFERLTKALLCQTYRPRLILVSKKSFICRF
jgi:hypothetical protein